MTRGRSFGAHAAAYERARPEYPLEAARWLAPGDPRLVVELGAGTGKLTRALSRLGLEVTAIEPDERMLEVLRGHGLAGVRPVVGTAESIPLADGAADAVVSGSAFHWFDLEPTLAEVARVLAPRGTLGFAWNRRDDRDPAAAKLTALIRAGERARWAGDRDWPSLVAAGGLFEDVEHADFRHVLSLPLDALGDHLRSYSRVGSLPAAEQDELVARARGLVAGEARLVVDGVLRLPFAVEAYRTRRRGG